MPLNGPTGPQALAVVASTTHARSAVTIDAPSQGP